jgi:hypothetical protein
LVFILLKPIRVNLAVNKGTLNSIVENRKLGGTPKDKRNLYLANEGLQVKRDKNRVRNQGKNNQGGEGDVIEMSNDDKLKRERSQQEKTKKLQNPLFFVSANR